MLKLRWTKSLMKKHWLTCHVPDRYPLGSLIKVYMAWNWHFQLTIMLHEKHWTELILPHTSVHLWLFQHVLPFAIFTHQSFWKTLCFQSHIENKRSSSWMCWKILVGFINHRVIWQVSCSVNPTARLIMRHQQDWVSTPLSLFFIMSLYNYKD